VIFLRAFFGGVGYFDLCSSPFAEFDAVAVATLVFPADSLASLTVSRFSVALWKYWFVCRLVSRFAKRTFRALLVNRPPRSMRQFALAEAGVGCVERNATHADPVTQHCATRHQLARGDSRVLVRSNGSSGHSDGAAGLPRISHRILGRTEQTSCPPELRSQSATRSVVKLSQFPGRVCAVPAMTCDLRSGLP